MKKICTLLAMIVMFASCTKRNELNSTPTYLNVSFTVEQSNVASYVIQTSIDAISFSDAQVIKANAQTSYTYTYKVNVSSTIGLDGKLYSRIKSIDIDGTVDYSPVHINTIK